MGHDNPMGKALLYTIILSAVTHLSLSLFYSITNNQPEYANMFHILGFDLLWPQLAEGKVNAILGMIFVAAIWAVIVGLLYKIHGHDSISSKVNTKPNTKSKNHKKSNDA
jgi:hypothetical protein